MMFFARQTCAQAGGRAPAERFNLGRFVAAASYLETVRDPDVECHDPRPMIGRRYAPLINSSIAACLIVKTRTTLRDSSIS
jgi:hypothetical protein